MKPNAINFQLAMKEHLDSAYSKCTGGSTDYFSSAKLPSTLFRYTVVNKYTDDELRNGVSMLKVSSFNDVYDSPMFEKDDNGTFIKCDTAKDICGRCFCEIKNSIVMWSTYSNHHTGICIEYETEPYSCSFVKVKYVEEPVYVTPLHEQDLSTINCLEALPLVCKHKGWENEKEWRILVRRPFPGDNVWKVPLPVKAIYFGCAFGSRKINNLEKQYYRELRDYILENKVPTFVGQLMSDRYGIEFLEVNVRQLINADGSLIYHVVNDRGEYEDMKEMSDCKNKR